MGEVPFEDLEYPPTLSVSPGTPAFADAAHGEAIDISALFAIAESVVGHGGEASDRLCHAVVAITHDCAWLELGPLLDTRMERAGCRPGSRHLPVGFSTRRYGRLVVRPDSTKPAAPAITETVSRQLAHACGAVLYLLEQAALIQVLSQHLPSHAPEHLTRRQLDVLRLMAQGADDDAIVEALHIAPETLRKHRYAIYARLGVHCAQDVLLAAYQLNVLPAFAAPPF